MIVVVFLGVGSSGCYVREGGFCKGDFIKQMSERGFEVFGKGIVQI